MLLQLLPHGSIASKRTGETRADKAAVMLVLPKSRPIDLYILNKAYVKVRKIALITNHP